MQGSQRDTKNTFVPTHVRGVFSLPVRVYNHDIDAGRVVFVANYLKFMERARTEWLMAIGICHRHLERDLRATFVLRDVELQCLRPARLDDLLHTTVQVEHLGRSSVSLRQTVTRDGTLLCTATMVAVLIDVVKFRPTVMPKEVRRILEIELVAARDDGAQIDRLPLAAHG
jgi:acyl-CoA thioester hydrolase